MAMLSVVNFRMHHGIVGVYEQITFTGNGIKLIDLKKEVVDRKKINKSQDFDLKVVDENGKGYNDDDEFVPKNASLVVKRIPATAKNSLLTRLANRATSNHHTAMHHQKPVSDIFLPMKMEEEEEEAPLLAVAVSVPAMDRAESNDTDMMALMEEDSVLKRTAPVGNTLWGGVAMQDPAMADKNRGRMPGVAPPQSLAAQSYACTRCNKMGHAMKYCPTIGDPAFDPEIKLMNIPKAGRKNYQSLDGVDTTNKTVIPKADGTYEIFESSSAGLNKLGEGAHLSAVDMTDVPNELKCAMTGAFLREAVSLPCCNNCVNDSVIRQALVTSGLRCPICGTHGISPDSLIMRNDKRAAVEDFIRNRGQQQQQQPMLPHQQQGYNGDPNLQPQMQYPPYGGGFPGGPPPAAGYPPAAQHQQFAYGGPAGPMNGHQMMPPAAPMNRPPPPPQQQQPVGFYGQQPPPQAFGGGPDAASNAWQGGVAPGFPPAMNDIPPLEALPLPMAVELFLQEQEFQRQERVYLEQLWYQRLDSMGGGGGGGGGGYRGGYQGRSSWNDRDRDSYRERDNRDNRDNRDGPRQFDNLHYKRGSEAVSSSSRDHDRDAKYREYDSGSKSTSYSHDRSRDRDRDRDHRDTDRARDRDRASDRDRDRRDDTSSKDRSRRRSSSTSRRDKDKESDRSSRRRERTPSADRKRKSADADSDSRKSRRASDDDRRPESKREKSRSPARESSKRDSDRHHASSSSRGAEKSADTAKESSSRRTSDTDKDRTSSRSGKETASSTTTSSSKRVSEDDKDRSRAKEKESSSRTAASDRDRDRDGRAKDKEREREREKDSSRGGVASNGASEHKRKRDDTDRDIPKPTTSRSDRDRDRERDRDTVDDKKHRSGGGDDRKPSSSSRVILHEEPSRQQGKDKLVQPLKSSRAGLPPPSDTSPQQSKSSRIVYNDEASSRRGRDSGKRR